MMNSDSYGSIRCFFAIAMVVYNISSAHSQLRDPKPVNIVIGIGTSYMDNDLSINHILPSDQFLKNITLNAELEKEYNDWFSYGIHAGYIRINGKDQLEARGYHFCANLYVVSGLFTIEPISLLMGEKQLSTPYLSIQPGIGFAQIIHQGFAQGSDRPYGSDQLKSHSIAFIQTIGVGYKIYINSYIDIKLEVGYSKTNSDFLDGLSTKDSKYMDAFIPKIIKFTYKFDE